MLGIALRTSVRTLPRQQLRLPRAPIITLTPSSTQHSARRHLSIPSKENASPQSTTEQHPDLLRRPRATGDPRTLYEGLYDVTNLEKLGVHHNDNSTGFSFARVDEPVRLWMESCAGSRRPLVDIGAGVGFQTVAALKAGRDVVVVDGQERHLDLLKKRVAELERDDGAAHVGKLLDAKCALVPKHDLFDRDFKASGILVSEVMHFLKPGQPLQLMQQLAGWLEPNALLVTTNMTAIALDKMVAAGMTLPHNRTPDQVWEFVMGASDADIVGESPTFMDVRGSVYEHLLGESVYFYTAGEMVALARMAGFEVEDVRYLSPNKYPIRFSDTDETCMLVARKVGGE